MRNIDNFKFNDEGKLIIDSAWHDVRHPSRIIVIIDKELYWVRNVFYRFGSDVAASLHPAKGYVFNPSGKCMLKYRDFEYLSFPCVEK